jgi:FkbM family methyltransferase
MMQRARLARRRHPDLGEISAYCFYATKLRYGDLAFDIGANHGVHAARMLARGARVVAVEPQARLARELTARLPSATVLPLAVGDESGRAVLHHARESDGLASLDPTWSEYLGLSGWYDDESVLVVTLDELLRQHGEPRLIKIDTEGFDHRVLRGLSRPIEHILFELHAARLQDAEESLVRLDNLGRYALSLSRRNRWLFARSTPTAILEEIERWDPRDWGNVYACRE